MASLPAPLQEALGRREIPTLNGLRAIAVIFVVLNHAGLPLPGGFGVLTFFTLSGFLITWLLLAEHRRTGAISLKNFYLRRTLRIFPAYYVYAALLIGLLLWKHKPINVPQAIAALLYLNNYFQAILGDPNTGFSHTWSLAVEEQFYLLWAPAILLLLRRGKVLPALCAAIVYLWAHRLVLIFLGVGQGYIYEAFDTRADHLLIGCLLAFLLSKGEWPGLFRLVCRPWVAALVFAGLTALNVAEVQFGTDFRDTFAFTLEPALVALLIPGLLEAKDSLAYRFLESAPVSGIGRISYSMYLYQQLLVGPVDNLFATAPTFLRALVLVLVTIFAGLCSYHLVEKPFLRLKDRIDSRGSQGVQ